MTRRVLVLGGLFVCLALAGCTGSASLDEGELVGGNTTYDWNTSAAATLDLNDSAFSAVYDVENRSTFEAFQRDGFGQERPLRVSAVRYRFPNGTVITVTDDRLGVEQEGGRAVISLPANANGSLAFTAPRFGKTFSIPAFVAGSHRLTLPHGARVGIPILAQVSPPGFSSSVGPDDRMTLYWEGVDAREISLQWYLQRDVLIFGFIVVVGILAAFGGSAYYYRQIKRLERRREEVGLDIDQETDDDLRDRGPPPGMR